MLPARHSGEEPRHEDDEDAIALVGVARVTSSVVRNCGIGVLHGGRAPHLAERAADLSGTRVSAPARPSATAPALGVHVNTLYQRLAVIDRVLGPAWRERALELQVLLRVRAARTGWSRRQPLLASMASRSRSAKSRCMALLAGHREQSTRSREAFRRRPARSLDRFGVGRQGLRREAVDDAADRAHPVVPQAQYLVERRADRTVTQHPRRVLHLVPGQVDGSAGRGPGCRAGPMRRWRRRGAAASR